MTLDDLLTDVATVMRGVPCREPLSLTIAEISTMRDAVDALILATYQMVEAEIQLAARKQHYANCLRTK